MRAPEYSGQFRRDAAHVRSLPWWPLRASWWPFRAWLLAGRPLADLYATGHLRHLAGDSVSGDRCAESGGQGRRDPQMHGVVEGTERVVERLARGSAGGQAELAEVLPLCL